MSFPVSKPSCMLKARTTRSNFIVPAFPPTFLVGQQIPNLYDESQKPLLRGDWSVIQKCPLSVDLGGSWRATLGILNL